MRIHRVVLSFALIPVLIADPSGQLSGPALKLLRKPSHGQARLTLVDGTLSSGYVRRITNQFFTLSNSHSCENIDVARIAKVHLSPDRDYMPIYAIMAFPLYLIYPLRGGALMDGLRYVFLPRRPMLGEWESLTGEEEVGALRR
jgi:hypothetical protein